VFESGQTLDNYRVCPLFIFYIFAPNGQDSLIFEQGII